MMEMTSEHPCELKNLNVALNIAGVEKMHSEILRLRSILEAIGIEF